MLTTQTGMITGCWSGKHVWRHDAGVAILPLEAPKPFYAPARPLTHDAQRTGDAQRQL